MCAVHLHLFVFAGNLYTKGDIVGAWLHKQMDDYADFQPDTKEVHLPYGTKLDVYREYIHDVAVGTPDLLPVSRRFFLIIWNERLPHLKKRTFHRCLLSFGYIITCF